MKTAQKLIYLHTNVINSNTLKGMLLLVLGRVQKSSGSGLLIYLEFGFGFVRVYYKLKCSGSGSRRRVYRVFRVSFCRFYCIFMRQFFRKSHFFHDFFFNFSIFLLRLVFFCLPGKMA